MQKQEVSKSPVPGWRVWINSITRHFSSKRELLLSKIQTALFPILLVYLWVLFPYVLCAAALREVVGELESCLPWSAMAERILLQTGTMLNPVLGFMKCEDTYKNPHPRTFLYVFFCSPVYNSKGYCEGGISSASTFWEQDGNGLVQTEE